LREVKAFRQIIGGLIAGVQRLNPKPHFTEFHQAYMAMESFGYTPFE